ncbi:hypothetical protein G6F66_014686 [Rhizopus arrhizus]|nr:hypothetical protein G6F66_014686 [Rhizopus arrhizus]
MESIMPVAALVMLCMAIGLGYMGVMAALEPTESMGMRVFVSASAGLGVAALAAVAFLCDPESLLCCRRQAMPVGLEQRQALCPRRPRLGPARGAADDGSRPHGDLS